MKCCVLPSVIIGHGNASKCFEEAAIVEMLVPTITGCTGNKRIYDIFTEYSQSAFAITMKMKIKKNCSWY